MDTVQECDRRTDGQTELRSQRPCNAERRTVISRMQLSDENGKRMLFPQSMSVTESLAVITAYADRHQGRMDGSGYRYLYPQNQPK